MHSNRFFIFLLIILSACNSTESKNELKPIIKKTPLVIEKEGITIYQLQENKLIDSLLLTNQTFITFKNSIEDLSKLNQAGLGPFLVSAINNCNQLLKAPLSAPFNTPDIRSRLKIVKTELLKARYYSKEEMQEELNQNIKSLYVAYSAYLKRIEDFSNQDGENADEIVQDKKLSIKARR